MKNKIRIRPMLPILAIMLATVLVSVLAYGNIMDNEKKQCWHLLYNSAEAVKQEVTIRFEDNINMMRLKAENMVKDDWISSHEAITKHINTFQKMTIFSRIDVLYPDNTVLLQNGTISKASNEIPFSKVLEKGEHISERTTDLENGREVVYYCLPIKKDNQAAAILIGVIDCANLYEFFETTIYDGRAYVCLVDSKDGNFIMDHWHETLGNLFNMSIGKSLKGYENINLVEDVRNHRTGGLAYQSKVTGVNAYMYYTPAGIFDWELLVVVQENVAFANLLYVKRIMIGIGIGEMLLIFAYLFWNLFALKQLAKSQRETERQLETSTTLIKCVTELSSDRDIDISIQNLLQIINQYFWGDRTYIFEIDYASDTLSNTYEYVIEGVTKEINSLQNIPIQVIDIWMEKFQEKGSFYISDIEEENSEKDPRAYEILKAQHVHRLIAVPLLRKGEIIGFLGVDNPGKHCRDVTLLSSIQFFVTNSLMTKLRQEKLSYLSYRDMLTNLYNRNKYINVVEKYANKQVHKIGVAYMDLNGLKPLNDELGHEAGDAYIKKAAKQFSEVFPEHAYRIGGDEFVILFPDVEKEEFYRKLQELQDKLQANEVSISFGASWMENCEDLEGLLKQVDHLMYEEKKKYYNHSTNDRRKQNR